MEGNLLVHSNLGLFIRGQGWLNWLADDRIPDIGVKDVKGSTVPVKSSLNFGASGHLSGCLRSLYLLRRICELLARMQERTLWKAPHMPEICRTPYPPGVWDPLGASYFRDGDAKVQRIKGHMDELRAKVE